MPQLSSYNLKMLLIAVLFAALAAVHVADFGSLVETPLPQHQASTRLTTASVDEVVAQSIKQYDYARYRNVIDDSIFAVNIVIKEKPVKIVKAEPVPAEKPPPPSKIKPFTANLEVTGIAITPERKLVMIWDKQRNEAQILLEKEELYQWKVVSIEKHMVILEHESGELYEFLINDETLTNFKMQR